MCARKAGLIPKQQQQQKVPQAAAAAHPPPLIDDGGDDFCFVSNHPPKSLLSSVKKHFYAKSKKQNNSGENVEEFLLLPKQQMVDIFEDWYQLQLESKQWNDDHWTAILCCTLYLVDCFTSPESVAAPSPFSLVIQGGGGTGKTQSVISGIRDFLEHAVACSKCELWKEALLLLAPTNIVAQSIGGKTIDSGLVNRRRPSDAKSLCSVHVKLIVIDEFSMVSLENIDLMHRVLCEQHPNNKDLPFGGIAITWIGDIHQLPCVMGAPVTKTIFKNSLQQSGHCLWQGSSKSSRYYLCVTMSHQYRMSPKLNAIATRFSNGNHTLEDVKTLCAQQLIMGPEECVQLLGDYRVLCTDNNAKAALNANLVASVKPTDFWVEWESITNNNNNSSKRKKKEKQGQKMM